MKKADMVDILTGKPGRMILPGTLSLLRQKWHQHGCRQCRQGGHGPYWYLTWNDNGKSRALYVPETELAKARKGVLNMKRLRQYVKQLCLRNVRHFHKEMERKRR